jgi:alkylated DNA repair dioxygenase AlkB
MATKRDALSAAQQELFSFSDQVELIELPFADIALHREFFSRTEADSYMSSLLTEINWTQEKIRMFGEYINIPRLTAWHGDNDKPYTYSGIQMLPQPWSDQLTSIKNRIESAAETTFNSVLLNHYRSGNDSVSWHADDEPELGLSPVIGSVSFGTTRKFAFRPKGETKTALSIDLNHGDVLIMKGQTQQHWEHQVPKSKAQASFGSRINLTFRAISDSYELGS